MVRPFAGYPALAGAQRARGGHKTGDSGDIEFLVSGTIHGVVALNYSKKGGPNDGLVQRIWPHIVCFCGSSEVIGGNPSADAHIR